MVASLNTASLPHSEPDQITVFQGGLSGFVWEERSGTGERAHRGAIAGWPFPGRIPAIGRKFITEGGTDAMEIKTTRFGALKVEAADLIQFPGGMPGLEACRTWVLLTDAGNECLGWLQSTERPEIALAVVSPRRFVPNYQLRVSKSELEPLALADVRQAQVLVIVSKHDGAITLNLKAPLVINPEVLIGRQVVANGELPVQYSLVRESMPLRKSA